MANKMRIIHDTKDDSFALVKDVKVFYGDNSSYMTTKAVPITKDMAEILIRDWDAKGKQNPINKDFIVYEK